MKRFTMLASALALAVLFPAVGLAQSTGSADFTRYVALGDSLTAGFTSNALSDAYQRNSFPALISRQATTNAFEQPLVSEPGFSSLPGYGILWLQSLSPLTILPTPGQAAPLNATLPRPYNNLAVPGARVHDTVATTSGGMHDLVLRNPAFQNTTALQQAASLHPTFVSLWIGNNDALAAATSGIVIDDVTLTTAAKFEADYRTIVNTLSAAGAKFVFANIPDVTSIPFVTTLPYVVLNPATNQPVLVNGAPVPLLGPDGPLTAADYVLLTAQAEMRQGRGIPVALGGSGQPLSNAAVLSAAEDRAIHDRIAQFNAVIATVAREKSAPLVDANAVLRTASTTGLSVGGVTLTGKFLTGGLFSYDGVHPSALGYAYVANLFLDAINQGYGASIPPVDLSAFLFAKSGGIEPLEDEPFYFTRVAGVQLLRNLGVPQYVIDGHTRPPRRHRRGH